MKNLRVYYSAKGDKMTKEKSIFDSLVRRDAEFAFSEAIRKGYLSEDESSKNYFGYYMYMNTNKYGDHFKHIDTRRYITVKRNILSRFFDYNW